MKPMKAAALISVLLVPLLAFRFGGWAVITVDAMPADMVVGVPTPSASSSGNTAWRRSVDFTPPSFLPPGARSLP